MANGGKRPGAGRPKGSTRTVRVSDYFTEKEKREFFENLKVRAKVDTKIAIYLAEQLTGKAPQAITDADGNNLPTPILNVLPNQRDAEDHKAD